MLQSVALKNNTLLAGSDSPYQSRPKSSENKEERIHSLVPEDKVDDTCPMPLPTSLRLYHIVSRLQYLYGLRVSELLSLKQKDLTDDGFCLIIGKKGSNNRVIQSDLLLSIKHPNAKYKEALLFPFSYKQYYRVLKRYGVQILPTGKRVRSIVSHAYRHYRIKRVFTLTGDDLKATKNYSGQKNNISALHYINSK